jgi:hypothetical protein
MSLAGYHALHVSYALRRSCIVMENGVLVFVGLGQYIRPELKINIQYKPHLSPVTRVKIELLREKKL